MSQVIQIYAGNTLIADGTKTGGQITEMSVNGTRVIEKGHPLFAGWLTVFGLGNRENIVEFSIFTQQAAVIAALTAVFSANDLLTPQADFKLVYEDAAGNILAITLAGAAWGPSINAKFLGLSTTVKVGVVGGQFSITLDEGDGPAPVTGYPWPLPAVLDSLIDPLTVPEDQTGTIGAGEDLFCFAIVNNGQLVQNAASRLILVPTS